MPSAHRPNSAVQLANRRALAEYIVSLQTHLNAYDGINPFWREITDTFRKQFVAPADVAAAESRLQTILALIDSMPKTGYFVQPISEQQFEAAWRQILADVADPQALRADKARYEAAIVAHFLSHAGLLNDARTTLHALRIEPKYVTLRHFFYFTQMRDAIEQRLRTHDRISVLEVGAGGSTLKLLLKQHFGGRVGSYVIVDLPEMLCLSIKAGIEFFPNEAIQIVGEGSGPDLDHASIFIPAGLTGAMPRVPMFDLFLNTHSFQEMDPAVIASYFRLIYGTAREGALFFQTNLVQSQMSRLDGSHFVNDPARYPVRPTDDVLYRHEDPFHVYARNTFGYKSTRTLTSLRRIRSHEAAGDDPIGRAFEAHARSRPSLIERIAASLKYRLASRR
jgi:putative sugar O-methyltransferase